jgi:hypothetical protein
VLRSFPVYFLFEVGPTVEMLWFLPLFRPVCPAPIE